MHIRLSFSIFPASTLAKLETSLWLTFTCTLRSTEMIEKRITDLMLVVLQSDCWTLLSGLCLYCLMKPKQLWLSVASAFVRMSPQAAHPNDLILTVLQTYRMFIGWIDSYISLCVIGTNIYKPTGYSVGYLKDQQDVQETIQGNTRRVRYNI